MTFYILATGEMLTALRLPFLLDLESPVELEMCVVVVVNELGDGLVFASGDHAGGRGIGLDYWMSV